MTASSVASPDQRPAASAHPSQLLIHEMLRRPVEFTQYTSLRYTDRLSDAGIAQSVGSKGDSYDNALAESVNALYKKELIDERAWTDTTEVVAATADWVYWYNNERLHSWCDYRPPLEFEQVYWQDRPGQPSVAA